MVDSLYPVITFDLPGDCSSSFNQAANPVILRVRCSPWLLSLCSSYLNCRTTPTSALQFRPVALPSQVLFKVVIYIYGHFGDSRLWCFLNFIVLFKCFYHLQFPTIWTNRKNACAGTGRKCNTYVCNVYCMSFNTGGVPNLKTEIISNLCQNIFRVLQSILQ